MLYKDILEAFYNEVDKFKEVRMKKRFSRNTDPIIKYSYYWGLTEIQMSWVDRFLKLELLKPSEVRGFIKDWTGINVSRSDAYRFKKQVREYIPIVARGC
jgi:hypothetical protein